MKLVHITVNGNDPCLCGSTFTASGSLCMTRKRWNEVLQFYRDRDRYAREYRVCKLCAREEHRRYAATYQISPD